MKWAMELGRGWEVGARPVRCCGDMLDFAMVWLVYQGQIVWVWDRGVGAA